MARHGPCQRGSLSLEAALAVPLVAVVAMGLLQVLGVARDALLAQDLARLGVRVAATTTSDAAVREAIVDAAGAEVTTHVRIAPPVRRRGTAVVVEVELRRPGRVLDAAVTGRAVAHGEPQLAEDVP